MPALVVTDKQPCCAGSHVERNYKWDKPEDQKYPNRSFTRAAAITEPRVRI